jgi:hypothetical protein
MSFSRVRIGMVRLAFGAISVVVLAALLDVKSSPEYPTRATAATANVPISAAACTAPDRSGTRPSQLPVTTLNQQASKAFVDGLLKDNAHFRRAKEMADREFKHEAIAYSVHLVGAQPNSTTPSRKPESPWRKLLDWLSPTARAQTFDADNGGGYAVLATYADDGEWQWDGNVYVQSYSGEVWMTIDFGAVKPDYSVNWTGSHDGRSGPHQVRSGPLDGVLGFFSPVVHANPCSCGPARWADCILREAITGSWSTCSFYAYGCRFSVEYWGCLGIGCGASFGSRLLDGLWAIRNGCA